MILSRSEAMTDTTTNSFPMELGHNQLPVILSVTGSLAGLTSPNLGRDNRNYELFPTTSSLDPQ